MSAALIELRPARPDDLPSVVALLDACGLPIGDVTKAMLASFCVAETEGNIVGVAGLEAFDIVGLLRSLAVAEDQRGGGLAARLVDWCEAGARRRGVETAYLLTTTAAEYFRKRGYEDVPRDAVPATIAGHAQFRGLCPASAKCLAKHLARSCDARVDRR